MRNFGWRLLLCIAFVACVLCPSQAMEQEPSESRREKPARGQGATVVSGEPISPYGFMDFATTALQESKRKPVFRYPRTVEMPAEGLEEENMPYPADLPPLAPAPEPLSASLPELTLVNSKDGNGEAPSRAAGTPRAWARIGAISDDSVNTQGYWSAPSDMALCAGSGYVLQAVNVVFKVYTSTGGLVSGPLAMLKFFKQNFDSLGSFFDPRCVYDPYYKRFYVAVARKGGTAGASDYYSDTLLAVSASSNPARGWYLYKLDAASIGQHGCTVPNPCWIDFPTLGFDRYGIWVGGNLWFATSGGGNMPKFWAVGKQVTNGSTVVPQQFTGYWPGYWTSQPASTQGGSSDDVSNGGTMYVVYGASGYGVLYTITQTSRLLLNQKPVWRAGVFYSAQSTSNSISSFTNTYGAAIALSGGCCENIAFAGGLLYAVGTSAVNINGTSWNGIAWYAIDPATNSIRSQGVAARAGYHLFKPAITASPTGQIVFVSCVTGPDAIFKNGFMTAMGSIDPTTGTITKFQTFATTVMPMAITTSGSFRTGDYSAIYLSDDGFAYGSAQQSQKSGASGIFQWGTTIWGRWTP